MRTTVVLKGTELSPSGPRQTVGASFLQAQISVNAFYMVRRPVNLSANTVLDIFSFCLSLPCSDLLLIEVTRVKYLAVTGCTAVVAYEKSKTKVTRVSSKLMRANCIIRIGRSCYGLYMT